MYPTVPSRPMKPSKSAPGSQRALGHNWSSPTTGRLYMCSGTGSALTLERRESNYHQSRRALSVPFTCLAERTGRIREPYVLEKNSQAAVASTASCGLANALAA